MLGIAESKQERKLSNPQNKCERKLLIEENTQKPKTAEVHEATMDS